MSPSASPLKPGERLRWPWALGLLPAVPLLLLLLSALVPQQRLALRPVDEGVQLSEPFRLDGGPLGSPFLEVRADLPRDTTITYRVELLDSADRVVLALSRDGWRETGVWSEDGESGTYDESESAVPLALRPQLDGLHRLRLELEELSGSDGLPRRDPVAFQATLVRHRLNAPLLLLTSAAAAVASGCAWQAIYGHCRRRQRLRGDEPRITLRTDLGPGLVRLTVTVRYEPDGVRVPEVPLELRLRDGMGRERLRKTQRLRLLALTINDDLVLWGRHTLVLRLPERCHLQLRLAVPADLRQAPDALERFQLTVEDGVRLPWAVPVLEPWNAT